MRKFWKLLMAAHGLQIHYGCWKLLYLLLPHLKWSSNLAQAELIPISHICASCVLP
jgi:hypothetical protein